LLAWVPPPRSKSLSSADAAVNKTHASRKEPATASPQAFQEMPARENVPVIDAIWKEFVETEYTGDEHICYEVRRALRAHKQIVGKDLGPDPQPWLDWYEEQKRAGEDE